MKELTTTEMAVVDELRKIKVGETGVLAEGMGVTRRTILRGLRKYGYYSSFNFNSRYVTLRDTPKFARDGLWFWEEVGFSKHGTLEQTVAELVRGSSKGRTVCELEERLGTQVHNQLSKLVRGGEIDRFYVGHQAVYISREEEQGKQQRTGRTGQVEEPAWGEDRIRRLPEGLDVGTVVPVLLEMINRPDASIASVSRKLQAQGIRINADQIRLIITFYDLKKKER
jgi:hypothetical protein